MNPEPPILDVEFEVITPPKGEPLAIESDLDLPPFPKVEWSFWKDDFPQLSGMIAAILFAILARSYIFSLFRHH